MSNIISSLLLVLLAELLNLFSDKKINDLEHIKKMLCMFLLILVVFYAMDTFL